MNESRVKRGFLQLLKHTLNPLTSRVARSGRGPFALVRHVGRTTGTTYETPLILARRPEGFVAELTYGPGVSWYRNVVAAGGCVIVYRGADHVIDRITECPTADGLAAYGRPRSFVLKSLHRNDFRYLHERGRPEFTRGNSAGRRLGR